MPGKKKRISFFKSYCGKTFGLPEFLGGFLVGGAFGVLAGALLFSKLLLEGALGLFFGMVFGKAYLNFLKDRRQKEFLKEFCDYLDSVSTSLSVGRNGYEAFLVAKEDMEELYRKDTPIVYVSGRMAEGLKNGRSIPDMLTVLAAETECSEVRTFGEIYRLCSSAGGNLKLIVGDTRNMLIEKISVEQEIQTVLTGPKNELNIMVLMPFAILAALRFLGGGLLAEESSFGVNAVALLIFAGSYLFGRSITHIEV